MDMLFDKSDTVNNIFSTTPKGTQTLYSFTELSGLTFSD